MKNIHNPFEGLKGFDCFGCCPDNPIGLKMKFIDEGEHVTCLWSPSSHLQGYVNVLHGGIQATLMDEIASWTVYVKAKTAGVTSSLKIEYLKPVFINRGPVLLKGKLISSDGRKATVNVELLNNENTICSKAVADFYIFPEDVARQRYHYPGHENFFA